MIELEVSYKGAGGKITTGDPRKVTAKTVKELLEYSQTLLIATAKDFLRQEIAQGTFPEEYITIVDNRVGKREETVKPLGKIEYVTKIGDVRAVILDIFKMVSERTAIKSGYYSSMHILMYNGQVVAKGYRNAFAWINNQSREYRSTDKFRIINLAPYARKLERLGIRRGTRGQDKGKITRKYRTTRTKRGNTTRAPNGAYWLARGAARRQYPQLKNNIKFSFIPVSPSIAKGQNLKSFSGSDFTFKTGKGKGRPYLYPSITISLTPTAFSSNAGFTERGDNL